MLQTHDRGYAVLYEADNGAIEHARLAKTDASGDLSWSEYLDIIGESMLQTSDDGYVVVGEVNEPRSACYDVGLVKVDASGHTGIRDSHPISGSFGTSWQIPPALIGQLAANSRQLAASDGPSRPV